MPSSRTRRSLRSIALNDFTCMRLPFGFGSAPAEAVL